MHVLLRDARGGDLAGRASEGPGRRCQPGSGRRGAVFFTRARRGWGRTSARARSREADVRTRPCKTHVVSETGRAQTPARSTARRRAERAGSRFKRGPANAHLTAVQERSSVCRANTPCEYNWAHDRTRPYRRASETSLESNAREDPAPSRALATPPSAFPPTDPAPSASHTTACRRSIPAGCGTRRRA